MPYSWESGGPHSHVLLWEKIRATQCWHWGPSGLLTGQQPPPRPCTLQHAFTHTVMQTYHLFTRSQVCTVHGSTQAIPKGTGHSMRALSVPLGFPECTSSTPPCEGGELGSVSAQPLLSLLLRTPGRVGSGKSRHREYSPRGDAQQLAWQQPGPPGSDDRGGSVPIA